MSKVKDTMWFSLKEAIAFGAEEEFMKAYAIINKRFVESDLVLGVDYVIEPPEECRLGFIKEGNKWIAMEARETR